jgi:kynurenine formamidase
MFIDLTVLVTEEMVRSAGGNEKKALAGHLGTHFDVMDKDFPLDYLRLKAHIFDVRSVVGRDITLEDIDIEQIENEMFIIFYTGYIDDVAYGSKAYFKEHPQLDEVLIEALVEREVAIIGIDCAGIRRGTEHTPMDQYCADRGAFVVENLCNLGELMRCTGGKVFTAYTFPVRYAAMTGLPCRIIAEVAD